MDLATFQRAFTAARGYFRQMLTLRTLVADSFWQGFASGAGEGLRAREGTRGVRASVFLGGLVGVGVGVVALGGAALAGCW